MVDDFSLISFFNNISPIYQYLISIILAIIITTHFYFIFQHYNCIFIEPNVYLPTNINSVPEHAVESNENYCCSLEVNANEWEIVNPLVKKCCQSPINICKKSINVLERHFSLRWKRYEEVPDKMMLINDGTTIMLTCDYGTKSSPSITQIDQQFDEYCFKCIKFRFSMSNGDGSEHMIESRKYPMEMQITHETRPVRREAKTLILSYFFNIVYHDNIYLEPIIRSLSGFSSCGASCLSIQDTFPLAWLLPQFETGYFSYMGSLTEPPYTENIFWIVQPEPLAVSEYQMHYFRRMLIQNYFSSFHYSRPVQNLNLRNIFYNIPERCHGKNRVW